MSKYRYDRCECEGNYKCDGCLDQEASEKLLLEEVLAMDDIIHDLDQGNSYE